MRSGSPQLGRRELLKTGAAALKAYPEINPKYIQWWDDGARKAKGGPVSSQAPKPGGHTYAIDDNGKRRKVLDPNAQLPKGWKWAD